MMGGGVGGWNQSLESLRPDQPMPLTSNNILQNVCNLSEPHFLHQGNGCNPSTPQRVGGDICKGRSTVPGTEQTTSSSSSGDFQ